MRPPGLDDAEQDDARERPTEAITGSRHEASGSRPAPTQADTEAGPPAPAGGPGFSSPLEERYELGERIGSGGFGVVHRGFDRRLGRPVAIKMSRADRAPIGEVDPLLMEARKAASLQHPGIVTVHDVGVVDGRCWIVTELLDGVGLDAWLRSHRPGWAASAEIVALIADAAAHAHSRGVIHRDLKPSNVILVDGRRPVLLDLGLAMTDEGGGRRDRGLILGTLSYMSPEQARGESHRPDGRMDVYSLGVTLYEMLCGRRPFRARDAADLLWQVRESDPQPPRQVRPEIPTELERICLKAMAREPEGRHATASDLADDLRLFLAGASAASAAAPAPSVVIASGPHSDPTSPTPDARGSGRSRPSASSAGPERRQVTVLRCDFEGGEAGGDDDDEHERFVAFRDACRGAVAGLGGLPLAASGPSFLACFGYPASQEEAPRLAVAAGLAILADPAAGSARVAIQTGASIITEAGSGPPEVHGDVMAGLARLAALAEPGAVTVGATARRLIRGFFECDPAPGPPGSEAYRVVAKLDARNRVEAADPARLTPLIGRSREVELLMERWEQAEGERMGHVVLLIGDPGLGKSRLLHVIKEHVRAGSGAEDRRVVEWYCSPQHRNSPLYPAIDHLTRSFGLGGDPGGRLDLLAGRLAGLGLGDPEHLALFASLLSIPLDGRAPPLSLSPDRLKERLLSALADWLRALAGDGPVLFIVEDLHWVDPTTQEFLGSFVEQGGEDGTLAVFTTRPEYRPPWDGKGNQTQVALTRLTRRQVSDMMRAQTGAGQISQAVVDQIVDRTDGVPLFVEEFTRMLAEAVPGLGEGDDAGLTSSRVRAIAIPATLQDLLVARLDRMSSRKEVVQLGAVIGRSFSHEMIAAVSELDEETVRVELAKLVEVGMLFAKGSPPSSTYTFKHALIQDAAYQLLTKKPRQGHHRKIAETLESRFPEVRETKPELVAHHYTEAGDHRKGIDYWLLAGHRSRERSAHVEALGHLSKGLDLVRTLPGPDGRDGLELSFRLPLSASSVAIRGYASPEVEEHNRRARELCEALGGEAPLFDVMMVIWAVRFIQGRINLAGTMCLELLDLAEARDDDGLRTEAHWAAGCNAWWAGDFAESLRHCERAAGLHRVGPSVEHARFTGQNSGPLSLSYAAQASWMLGDADGARRHARAAMEQADDLNHPFTTAATAWQVGHMFVLGGDGSEGLRWADRVTAVSEEHAFAFWVALGLGLKGTSLLALGEHERAIPLLLDAIRRVEVTGCDKVHQEHLGFLAEALWLAGRTAEAREALDRGFAVNDRDGRRHFEAELHRRHAMLLRIEAPGDFEAAEAAWLRSIEVARRQGARFFELRSAAMLASAWHDRGRSAEAVDLLRPLSDGFPEAPEEPDLIRARDLLREIGP